MLHIAGEALAEGLEGASVEGDFSWNFAVMPYNCYLCPKFMSGTCSLFHLMSMATVL